MTTEFR